MSFQDCRQVVVHGHATNNVNGNQYNASVMHFSRKKRKRTEYDEFEQVKRGQIFTLERLHTEDLDNGRWWGWEWEWEWELKDGELVRKPKRTSSQRTICTVQVRPDQQAKYTAVIYEGDDADFFWKRDFERFSRAGLGKPDTWQLYGLNCSKIPFLIFHDEMVPLRNFYKKSFWGDFYVYMLIRHLNCHQSCIWLNMEGNLCKGLEGPDVEISFPIPFLPNIIVPPSVQMLQDEICFNFFQQSSSSRLEENLLDYAYKQWTRTFLDDLFPEPTKYQPSSDNIHSHWTVDCLTRVFRNPPHLLPLDIIDGLRFDTVYSTSRGAVARWPRGKGLWKARYGDGLVNETDMGDGLIRFKLLVNAPGTVKVSFEYPYNDFKNSWVAQSSRFIDAHGMSGMEEKCFMIDSPAFQLQTPWFGHQEYPMALKDLPPVYLFIYPPPLSVSELISWDKGHTKTHFWSLDENGQSEISEEECEQWGVSELEKSVAWHDMRLLSWPTDVYIPLRKWQVARGFDPSTADWAQSHGYPELEIIGRKEEETWFEGVQDYVSYLRKLHKPDVELQLRSPVQVQRPLRTRRYSWPTDVYTGLHNQQVARSFKCSECTKWIRSLGSLEFEFIGVKKGEARFKEFPDHAYHLDELCEQYAELLRWKSLRAAKEAEAKAKAKSEAEVKSEPITKLNDILESSAFLRDPSIESVENTPQSSPYDEQGALPEQNDPSSAQETPKEEVKSSSWWSWEAVTGSGISAFMC